MSWEDYGRYAVFQVLTDILSSSGKPLAYACAIELQTKDLDIFKEIMKGILGELSKYKIKFVGGDTKPGNKTSITSTMIGLIKRNYYSPRYGAKVGDYIYLTGYVGLFSLAGYLLSKNLSEKEDQQKLKNFIISPYIPYTESRLIIKYKANSGIDISDGLAIDLYKLAEESKVNIKLFLDKIPLHPLIKKYSSRLNLDPYRFVFNVGGDWQIVYTLSQHSAEKLEEEKRKRGLNFPIKIGEITSKSSTPTIEVYTSSGKYIGKLRKRGHVFEFSNIPYTEEIENLLNEDVLE